MASVDSSASAAANGGNSNAISELSNGINQYADYDARGVGMRTVEDPSTGVPFHFINVPTPAWFPDSFLRSLKRNLYFNMVNNASYFGTQAADANTGIALDFYKENSGGILSNLVTTAVKSVVNVARNQVMSVSSKVDSVVNGIASLSGGSSGAVDLESMIHETSLNPFLAAQPYVKVYGIHLAENVRDAWNAVATVSKVIANTFLDLVKDKNFTRTLDTYVDKWKKASTQALKDLGVLGKDSGDDIGAELQKMLTNGDRRMHNFAEAQMLTSISGYYTMTCKLPFFGSSSPMIQSSGINAFRTGWNGGSKNGLVDMARSYTNVVFSNNIKWMPENMADDQILPLTYGFNIYNDTLEHVLINLAFIWSFGATTQAVTDIITVRPPYLYDIEIPGGLRYKYCICGFKVTPEGKMRRISSVTPSGGSSIAEINDLFRNVFGFMVNPDALTHVPDYYKVEFSFRPLLPNLWNFVDSYLHDASSRPKTGQQLNHMLAKMVRNFNENAKGVV